MTANIHPSNLPFYHAVLDNLRAGREHGLQWASGDALEAWDDVPTYASGMPSINARWAEPLLLRMKPEEPARETIKIGMLELPKPAQKLLPDTKYYWLSESGAVMSRRFRLDSGPASVSEEVNIKHGLLFESQSDAGAWGNLFFKLRTGDPETIAAITQGNSIKLKQLEAEVERLKRKLEIRHMNDVLEQQREIDRDELGHYLHDKFPGTLWPQASFLVADAVIEHLNAKPIETNQDRADRIVAQWSQWKKDVTLTPYSEQKQSFEPKELVMPALSQISAIGLCTEDTPHTNLLIRCASELAIKALCQANADLFRERGIVVPKELK